MAIEKHKVNINGLTVTYYQLGAGRPLLFLHGGRVRALTFKKMLRLLGRRYQVIAPDIPGYGGSQTPHESWSFTEYAQFFDDFLAQLRLKNVTLVGYSMGGGIALNLAAMSKRIAQLVLVDSAGQRSEQTIGNKHRDLQRLSFYLSHPRYALSLMVLARDYTYFLLKHATDYRHIKRIRQACFGASYEPVIRQLNLSVLLVWGRDDTIYPLENARQLHRKIRNSSLQTVPGNHDWPVYNPSVILDHMI